AVDEMMRLFIATLPETAFAKSMQARKGGGRSGYDKDSIGVFERKMRGMAHQVSNLRYNPKIRGALDNMREYATEYGKTKGDNSTHVKYLDEFEKHLRYVLNPTKNDLGSILSSTAFHYTLGFNLSSALVNLANVPMIVAPYLMGKYSDASVSRALGDATKVFMASGRKAEIEMMPDGEDISLAFMMNVQAIKRRGTAEDVAAAIVFLCSDDAEFITGQNLVVDGGWMLN
ncbi:MAG: SDR family oxidoreductase, partial [Actinobacteria bacterium]|nr:SDR family oxidoreductase [Actinomycetota bacterium]